MREPHAGNRGKVVVTLEKDEDDYPSVEYESLWSTPGVVRASAATFLGSLLSMCSLPPGFGGNWTWGKAKSGGSMRRLASARRIPERA